MRNRILPSLVAVLLAVGCAGSPEPAAGASRTISVRVADGVVTPPAGRVSVPVGTRVHLVVDSDAPDTAHVHGYDIEFGVRRDTGGSADFTADITGVFDVELHDADLLLLELAVS